MTTCEHLQWEKVRHEQLNPLLARQVVSGEKAMIARVYLRKGCYVPPHSHEGEQLSYILEGSLEFHIFDAPGQAPRDKIVVGAGEILVIPSNVVHAALALEDTVDLDIFSPIRHDWLNGTDNYLRG